MSSAADWILRFLGSIAALAAGKSARDILPDRRLTQEIIRN
jgi:hypothetical protein